MIMKRVFAVVLVLMIALTSNMPVFGTPSDIQESDNKEAIEILTALNILQAYEDESFKPDNQVTRAEFAAFVTNLLGFHEQAENMKEKSLFSDVGEDFPAVGAINLMANMKIIQGAGDGKFNPDEQVTYEQVIKTLINALGYEVEAASKGGYPGGYMVVAGEKGLLKKVAGTVGAPVKRGQLAQLMYNSLEIDMMDKTGFGDNVKYSVIYGKNILTERLNINRKTGIVTGIDQAKLLGNNSLLADEVEIDGERYKIGKSNVKEYLGYHIEFYYTQDNENDSKTLLYIREVKQGNGVVVIKADDVKEYSDGVVTYLLDENIEKARISEDAAVLYNCKRVTDFNENHFTFDSGEIKCIDQDNDDKYDVVLISAYQTYVVDTIQPDEEMIFSKYGKDPIHFDTKDIDKKVSMVKDGQPCGLSDLKEWDVLDVVADEASIDAAMVLRIYVTGETVSGKVEEKEEDTYTIAGKEYKVLKSSYNNLLDVNDEGTFYLNLEGKIAAAVLSIDKGSRYGYLMKLAQEKGIKSRTILKLLTDDGKQTDYKCADNVEVIKSENSSDNQKLDCKQVVRELTTDGSINLDLIKRQLILYELNEEGQIKKIIKAVDKSGIGDYAGFTKEVFTKDRSSSGDTYQSTLKIFASKYYLSPNTIIFGVPQDANDYEKYKKISSAYFINDEDYKIDIFDSDDEYQAGIIVIRDCEPDFIPIKKTGAVVDKVTYAVNEAGNTVYKLTALFEGKKVEYLTEELDIPTASPIGSFSSPIGFKDLKRGDVIQFVENENKRITCFRPIFLYDSQKNSYVVRSNGGSNLISNYYSLTTLYGWVIRKKGDILMVGTNDASTRLPHRIKGANIYMFDKAKDRVSVASKEDIISAEMSSRPSKVLIHYSATAIVEVVIVKE